MGIVRGDLADSLRVGSAALFMAASLALGGCGGSDSGDTPAPVGAGGGGDTAPPAPTPAPPPPPPPPGSPEPPAPPAPPLTVETSLKALGFDTRITPRRDSDGIEYPQSYSPFGARLSLTERADGTQVFGNPTELVLAGVRLRNENEVLYTIDHISNLSFANPPQPSVLYRRAQVDVPWALESNPRDAAPQTKRDATAADVDGDGLQELVFAYVEGNQIRLLVKDFDPAAPTEVNHVVMPPASVQSVADVRVVAADVDQDGRDEIVLGVGGGAGGGVALLVLANVASGPTVLKELALPRTIAGSSVSLVLQSGSVDYDGASEFAIVVNELLGGSRDPDQAAARYYVFDDLAANFALLKSGPIEVVVDERTVTALVGHVAIGDIDKDQAGEVLLAGLAELSTNCDTVEHILLVLDDAVRGFRQRSASAAEIPVEECDQAGDNVLRHVFVNVLDVDGDDDLEIQVNQYIFEEAPTGRNWDGSPGLRRLGSSVLFPDGTQNLIFDRSFAAMTVADVNGDGRDDLITFRQKNEEARGSGPQTTFVAFIDIYGTNDAGTFTRIGRIELTPEEEWFRGINPIMVAISPDVDGQVLEYAKDHQLVFTEATVLAALATPPCGRNIGQNTDDCTTTWGRSEGVSAEGERELTIEAGITFGFKFNGGAATQSEASLKAKLSAAASLVRTQAYSLSKSTSYTTGPMEDSVVFYSVPVDVYTYRVISHPNAARHGSVIQVGLPRTPVVRLAERTYYNANLPAGAPTIGANVFQHTPGSIDSYPSAARKTQILQERRSQVERNRIDHGIGGRLATATIPLFPPMPAMVGLQSDAPGVGQGSGSTSVSLELNQENGNGAALQLGIELSKESTVAGVIFDISVGFSATWSFNLKRAEGTVYEGSVGSIDAANFAAQQYRFGLFTYLQADPDSGDEFEVINYWVER